MNAIVFEDEHLLVVNKPPGWNTHAPSPFANEGLYDWLKGRAPRWSRLAILHRLDKETSGLIVFGKTPEANRSLARQFESREVQKKYILLTDRADDRSSFTARSQIARDGSKYRSVRTGGEPAETRFRRLPEADIGPAIYAWEAEPVTGRTHQIRVHAAEHGLPILGDTLYGGATAARVCLHAAELAFRDLITGEQRAFRCPPSFATPTANALRAAIIDAAQTDAFRLIHGAADNWPGLRVDRLGSFLLAQSEGNLTEAQAALARDCAKRSNAMGVYHKQLRRDTAKVSSAEASPQPLFGEAAPASFVARENGLQFYLSFNDGYSIGLFLDQRDNRRRLLTKHIAADFPLPPPRDVLNAFAYTCAFSVCAAAAGARAASLDLSKKYLEWGQKNFALNQLDPSAHEFIYGDAFDWFRRMAKKKRLFDVVIVDPPTFSRSRESGAFQVEKDFPSLITAALPLIRPGGVLLACANAVSFAPEKFLDAVTGATARARRPILRQHYAPQPPDFPIHRADPAYLKTVWLQIG